MAIERSKRGSVPERRGRRSVEKPEGKYPEKPRGGAKSEHRPTDATGINSEEMWPIHPASRRGRERSKNYSNRPSSAK